MGKVTCGVHGSVCCWRCDHCPKCEGTFKRVGKGDYCPECTAWLKANGYIFSAYYSDYVKPEQDTEQGRQSRLDGLMATIQAAADRAEAPRTDLAVTEALARSTLGLPCYGDLADSDIAAICAAIGRVLSADDRRLRAGR